MVNRFYYGTLIVLVCLLGYLNYQILRPFLIPITWAVVLSILFYPLYAFFLKYLRLRSISSFLTLLMILLIIIGPFSYFSFLLLKELNTLSDYIAGGRLGAINNVLQHPTLMSFVGKVTSLLNINATELDGIIAENISRFRRELVANLTKGVREIVTVTFHFLIMALSIFFFLKDGPKILQKLYDYMPFSEQQKKKLITQVRDIIISTIYGGVIVAIAQGTLGGVAFFIVGISSPILWGVAMAIASFLPVVGPSLIWAPAAIYLVFAGSALKGVALALMGVFVISTVDNILRPFIIGNRTRMPFLAIFFSLLGGIKLFGLIGFILGPLVLAIFVSVVEILRSMEASSQV